MPIIAPSLLSANFLNLSQDFEMLNKSEAEWVHLDIMDGIFVPNLSFGVPIVEQCRKISSKIFDVHLMISNPDNYISVFKNAGADNLTIHIEVVPNILQSIEQIKKHNLKVGIAISPDTPVDSLKDVIDKIDLICVMSVYPGFGGQKFIENTISKIKDLKNMISSFAKKPLIEIDGGVTMENAPYILAAGADVLVAGNTVFKSKDPIQTIKLLKNIS